MKRYVFYYNGTTITKAQFLNSGINDNWENEMIDGEYSNGYYRAIEIEE